MKIKTCPLCGGAVSCNSFRVRHSYIAYLECIECGLGLQSDKWDTPQEAEAEVIERWNTRYEPPTPGGAIVPAGNERLEK
jgi:Lar family restriction alleviation protein